MSSSVIEKVKMLCRTYDIKPSKSKGQNFLIDQEIIKKIVKSANLSKTDTVLEVGPGLGILTESLVSEVKKIVSVELDQKLFNVMKAKFTDQGNLILLNEDILRFTPEETLVGDYKIVANLPYNITSIFLKKFLTTESRPTAMTLLLQKEVAERICAQPGQMSLLALSVQLYGKPVIVAGVNRDKFWPAPEVDSAILQISEIKNQESVDNFFAGSVSEKYFWQIAKIGFSSKRKQLQNNLASGLHISSDQAKKILNQANFDPKIRAQNLSVADWLKLAKIVASELKD